MLRKINARNGLVTASISKGGNMKSFNKREKALNRKASRVGAALGAVSVGAMLMALPGVTMAQDAAQPSGEVVVVTGIRASLQKSASQKKNNASIVEVITAEEIGKLPDQSIAESLARLPGVAGQRVGGDVQVINLRGTSPDFTVTTFNGRLQGSLGDGRGVEVDQYPSELINSVVVYKTPDASVAGQGLSGTVDMRSLRPLKVKGNKFSVSLRTDTLDMDQLNPDVDKNGWRGSFSYVDQFMDGKLGIALGYAHLDSARQTEHQKIWDYDGDRSTAATNANAMYMAGFENRVLSSHRERDGLMAVVEFKPNDNSHTTLDLYYSKYKQEEVMRGVEAYAAWGADPGLGVTRGNVIDLGGTKFTDTGTVAGVVPIVNNQFHGRDDSIFAGGINHEMRAGIWDLEFDLSYSKAEGNANNVEITGGYGAGRTNDSIAFDMSFDGFTKIDPALNYGDASKIYLGDNSPWGWGHDGFQQKPYVSDSYAAFDFKAKTDLSGAFIGKFAKSLELGANFVSHEKIKTSTDADLCLKSFVNAPNTPPLTSNQGGVASCGTSNSPAGTRRRSANPIVSIGNANLGFAGWGNVAAFDILGTLGSSYNIVQRDDNNAWNRLWGLNEEIFTAFTRLNIDTEFMGLPVSGNLGIQLIDSNTESSGWLATGEQSTPVESHITNHYTDALPSLNLAMDLTKTVKLRFGAAKQMARPRPDDLRASVSASLSLITNSTDPNVGRARWSGEGGNPLLKPWRATSYDLSLEWYLNPTSYVSLAGFYKTVDSYIYKQTIVFDFSSVPNPNNYPVVSNFGSFSSPQNGVAAKNGKDAFISGIEFATNLDFGSIWKPLEGFGIVGSYSKNDTNISPSGPNSSDALPGFSGESRNVTLYFEKYGFQARISERWRSGFRSDVAGLFSDRTFTYILPDSQVDAQIGYAFPDTSALKGLSVLLQAQNLTDTLYQTREGVKLPDGSLLPTVTERYGTRYMLGVTYKF